MAKTRKVRPDEQFIFVNGAKADTVASLRNELKKLSPEEFNHHVNGQKNDFYNWLRDCVDPSLAERIRNVRDQGQMIEKLR